MKEFPRFLWYKLENKKLLNSVCTVVEQYIYFLLNPSICVGKSIKQTTELKQRTKISAFQQFKNC